MIQSSPPSSVAAAAHDGLCQAGRDAAATDRAGAAGAQPAAAEDADAAGARVQLSRPAVQQHKLPQGEWGHRVLSVHAYACTSVRCSSAPSHSIRLRTSPCHSMDSACCHHGVGSLDCLVWFPTLVGFTYCAHQCFLCLCRVLDSIRCGAFC